MSSPERLTSWKEIASYLDTTTRTVMRWEAEGLPVHRLQLGKRPSVYAFPHELDEWVARRSRSPQVAEAEQPRSRRGNWRIAAALAACALVAAVTLGSRWEGGDPSPLVPDRLTPLTALPGLERSPALSPDGRRVAFARLAPGGRDFDVFVADLATGEVRPLAAGPRHEFAPTWTPDGKSVLYARETPDAGGDTMFANMYIAYDQLSEPMKEMLASVWSISLCLARLMD